ncbi:MAG: 23S rRNA (pseudouridine(1915)-N(3))-methyltransferase RlmH [Bacilli bacterium]|nr:23S rRNA (pseudouridine(1915)-N(3))-methyltransferase RlmH [Bacilli bacterium]
MKIKIISIGKLKEKYLKDAVNEYKKRLSKYGEVIDIELDEYKISDETKANIDIAIKKEGISLLSKIKDDDFVLLFDLWGKEVDSVGLANIIDKSLSSFSSIALVIGGSYGLSDDVRKRSNFALSLSKLTFPHQFVRVIALEQLYRAFKINNNEKYHK